MANITDITNPTTTVGAITRGVEIGLELVGFGLLCGIKKDTKEIRKTETDILAKARNIEADVKATKTNTTSVLNWIGKVDPVIMGTHKPVEQPVHAQQAVQQAPAQQAAPAAQTFTLEQVKELLDKQAAQQAPNITTIVTGDAKQPEAPAQQSAQQETAPQAPAQQSVDLNELMDKLNGLTTTVNQLVTASQQTTQKDDKSNNGKK